MSVELLPEFSTSRGSGRNRRVLLIAYSFPPVGGAGVQRPAKWTKYLPCHGWDVTVLTPENPSVPVRDDSLLAEIPDGTRIVRAKTWEPNYRIKQQMAGSPEGRHASGVGERIRGAARSAARRVALTLLQPDLQVLWVHNAIRAAVAELKRVPHDAILATVPPYSMLLIATALKRRFGLPVVFDFRDEWDLSSRYLEQAMRNSWSRFVQSRLQRSLLKQADAVIATTQASAATYQEKLGEVGNTAKSYCIYNGFDPEDFQYGPRHDGDSAGAASDRFRLVYAGTLWNLTDIEPLVQAIERLQMRGAEWLRRLEFVCLGRRTPQQQQVLDRLQKTACRVELRDYCRHEEVAGWLNSADALCLTLSGVPGSERVVPAKVFEYLAARKPILAIVPEGETARLVRQDESNGVFVPGDVIGIAQWLEERLPPGRCSDAASDPADWLEPFSRPVLAGQLADVLNSVTSGSSACRSARHEPGEPSVRHPLEGGRCLAACERSV